MMLENLLNLLSPVGGRHLRLMIRLFGSTLVAARLAGKTTVYLVSCS